MIKAYSGKGVLIGLTVLFLLMFSPFISGAQKKGVKEVKQVKNQNKITFDNKKIEIGLSLLELLKSQGEAGNQRYQETLKAVKTEIYRSFLNGPEGGTMRLLWQVIRLDEVIGKKFMGTETFMKHLDKLLMDRRGEIALRGGAAAMNNYGGMYSYHNIGTVIRNDDYYDGERGFALIFLYHKKKFIPWRLNCINKYGSTSEIYQYNTKIQRWRPRYIKRVVRFKDNGLDRAEYAYDPVYIDGKRTVAVLVKGNLYAATLEKNGKLTAIERIVVDHTKYPEVIGEATIHSFRMEKNNPVPLNPKDKVTVFSSVSEADRAKIKALLMKAGMPENPAGILSNNILKPGDYITVVGACFFRGSPKQIKKGSYTVCGFNRWNVGGEIAYLAEFKKNKLVRVNTGDTAVYDRFGKKTFVLGIDANGVKRTYAAVYDLQGIFQHATLHMNDMGGKMNFNKKNRLDPAGRRQVLTAPAYRSKKNPVNYRARSHGNSLFIRGQRMLTEMEDGFSLYNLDAKTNQFYTLDGLPINGVSRTRYQMMVSFPQRFQRRTYTFSRYNSQTPKRLSAYWPLENEAAILSTDDNGILHCNITQSSFFGTVIKTWETTYPKR